MQNAFLQLIKERDKREQEPFMVFIQHSLKEELLSVKRERDSYRQTSEALESKLGAGDLRTNTEQDARIREIEESLRVTQAQLTDAYRKNASNAEDMLAAIAKQQHAEQKEKEGALLVEEWSRRALEAEGATQALRQALDEAHLSNNVMKDEVHSVQARLISREDELADIKAENATLIARWMEMKNSEAARLNEVNDEHMALLQAAQREKDLKRQSDLLEKGKQALATGKAHGSQLSDMFAGGAFGGEVVLPSRAKRNFATHSGEANSLAYNITGSRFCTGGSDKYVKVWDSRSCNTVMTLSGAGASLMKVAWSNNEEYILGVSYDHSATVWHAQKGRQVHRLTGHIGKVFSGCFTADSTKCITGAHDRTLKMWDLQTGNVIKTIFCFSSCNDVCAASDYGIIASAHLDGALRVFDLQSGNPNKEIINAHSKQITSISVDPQTSSLLLTAGRDNLLKLWDMRSYEAVRTFSDEGYRSGLNWSRTCFSPDGAYVVAGGAEGSLFIWDAASGKLQKQLGSDTAATVSSVSWNPNGQQLASTDRKGKVTIWE